MPEQTARAEDDAAPSPEDATSPEGASGQPATEQKSAPADAVTADLKDKLLRSLAEMENLRKRTAREVAEARLYAATSFARDLLAVADNMRRALEAVTADMRESTQPAVKALIDGVELTERELVKTLEKNGVQQFNPQGEKFDPHLHQAMYEVPDASVPAGSVVQVVQPGYMIGERVLRPAMVGVSKGGPRPAPVVSTTNNQNRSTASQS